jgi:hypothetical protein
MFSLIKTHRHINTFSMKLFSKSCHTIIILCILLFCFCVYETKSINSLKLTVPKNSLVLGVSTLWSYYFWGQEHQLFETYCLYPWGINPRAWRSGLIGSSVRWPFVHDIRHRQFLIYIPIFIRKIIVTTKKKKDIYGRFFSRRFLKPSRK